MKTVDTIPPAWRIWLSTNPDIDGTAIWLERKFDVPVSGQWVSEFVVALPSSPSSEFSSPSSPGVVIFECTPLDGVTDGLERSRCLLMLRGSFWLTPRYIGNIAFLMNVLDCETLSSLHLSTATSSLRSWHSVGQKMIRRILHRISWKWFVCNSVYHTYAYYY
jgi:hypothetical protein